jgi:putative phosphoesterase
MSRVILLGIISDTHGLLRPEALHALHGSELIIHAGDVGKAEILESLRKIAPVVAVRGNVDTAPWADELPETNIVELGAHRIFVLHDRSRLAVDPAHAGFAAVVFGHTHKPLAEFQGRVMFLNPGSAGPRRFRLPITIARIRVSPSRLQPEIIDLSRMRPGQ